MKFALYFGGVALSTFLIFYLAPVEIYEGKIIGPGSELVVDLSMRTLFFGGELPDSLISENIQAVSPTIKGWMLLVVIHLGMPGMIAYRMTLNKKKEQEEKE